MMSFMPYSPRWLELRERSHEALAALARLRASDPSSPIVRQEYDEIRDGIEFEKSIGQATWSELVKPGIINRILIAFTLQVFQQWTGINVIMYYASDLFEGMGFSKDVASKQLNLVNAAINVVGTLPGMYLVERLGRRKLLLWGGFGMGTCHLLVCLFIGLSKEGSKLLAWGAVVSIYGFILFFSSTWGPVVWVYQSEIFPLRIRAKGTGVATFANWSMNAIIAKITPIIIEKVSFYFYLVKYEMGGGGYTLVGSLILTCLVSISPSLSLSDFRWYWFPHGIIYCILCS